MSANSAVPDPAWRPVERSRAYELVIAAVEEQIAAGSLSVGDRLPGERELAGLLGVSRAAVREAMRALEAFGVVRAGVGVGRDSGTILTAMSSESLTQFLRLHVALANFPMPDVIEARVMLERWSARLAARSATGEDKDALTELVARMDAPDIDRQTFNELDTQFHVALAEAGRNRLVADLTTAIRGSMRRPILRSFQENPDWETVRARLHGGHREVLDAILAGDGARAADVLEEHIRYAFASLSWG